MDNWEKIINGYREKAVAKDQSTMKLIEATVLGASADYKRAKVQLITGQVIDNLINQSGNKIYAGQWVKVGYLTYPSKGWIAFTNGEADPIKEGGGWVVETAAVYDRNNLHRWTAEQELMTVINAQTKLLYGGGNKFISLQGYCARMPYNPALAKWEFADTLNFGTKMSVRAWWRATVDEMRLEDISLELYINHEQYDSGTGRILYEYLLIIKGEDWQEYYFAPLTSAGAGDVFILPTVNLLSFAEEYNSNRGGTVKTVSTPHGYVQCNQIRIQLARWVGGDNGIEIIDLRNTNGQVQTVYIGGTSTSTNPYSCVMLEGIAEKYFDLAVTKRTEPQQSGG